MSTQGFHSREQIRSVTQILSSENKNYGDQLRKIGADRSGSRNKDGGEVQLSKNLKEYIGEQTNFKDSKL